MTEQATTGRSKSAGRRIQEGHGRSHVKGVAWSETKRMWRAQIQLHLGYYATEEEAGKAYVEAERSCDRRRSSFDGRMRVRRRMGVS